MDDHEMVKEMLESCRFPEDLHPILAFIGGSELHGAKVEGTDDTDWCGIFLEPYTKCLGLSRMDHFVHTTGDGNGNTPADVDVTFYSLRKWTSLAVKGNPSILQFQFAHPKMYKSWWMQFQWSVDGHLAAKSQLSAFLGYGAAQLARLKGERGQKNVKRAAIEEKYGYDTKYAMHALRLTQEGIEYAETGKITCPRPNAAELIDVRLGKYTLPEICEKIEDGLADLHKARDLSPLPATLDIEKINKIVADVYREFYHQ